MRIVETDIAVIGGGLVGASLAALLPQEYRVMVLESFPPQAYGQPGNYQPSYDARSTVLSWGTCVILREAGIWQGLLPCAQPIETIHVSDRNRWGSTLLRHQEEGLPALGYVIDNTRIGHVLLEFLRQKANVDYCTPATVSVVKPVADGVELRSVSNGEDILIHARLLVVADGARSPTCESLGIHTDTADYGQTGIIANLATSEPHRNIAYERFTESGPMALLPLMDSGQEKNRSALVWTLPASEAKKLMATSDGDFLSQLQERFGSRQGSFLKVGKRHAYPLVLSCAAEQVRQHIVVLGNAAHSLHPVAGQGFNLAMRDVAALCQVLKKTLVNGDPPGDISMLQGYLDCRKNDQLATTLFSDRLPSIFASKQSMLTVARGVGLLGIDLLPAIKTPFVRFAAGMRQVKR